MIVVWSLEYSQGRSMQRKFMWFATEKEAAEARKSFEPKWRNVTGPSKHVLVGKNGLIEFLNKRAVYSAEGLVP